MKIWRYQGIHPTALILLLSIVVLLWQWLGSNSGRALGLSTQQWFAINLVIPIAHQVFVVICWRLELHYHGLSKVFGRLAFPLFGIIFFILFFSRLLFLLPLAVADQQTVHAPDSILYGLAILISLPVVYTFYSVARYFGFKRALGIDHFDISYRRVPLVHRGIFRYTSNAMYIFGLAVLWLPGLLLASEAALLVALFHHLYIWVHYFTVEKPDMSLIYDTGD